MNTQEYNNLWVNTRIFVGEQIDYYRNDKDITQEQVEESVDDFYFASIKEEMEREGVHLYNPDYKAISQIAQEAADKRNEIVRHIMEALKGDSE